jgi:50S ribosomal subunit-associated GTPase HflX
MNTQAAEAWLILNEADAVEQRMLAMMNRVFGDPINREMFMSQLARTSALQNAMISAQHNNLPAMQQNITDVIQRTLSSAEVIIQDDFQSFTPRIAVRFNTPDGRLFLVQPRVSRS